MTRALRRELAAAGLLAAITLVAAGAVGDPDAARAYIGPGAGIALLGSFLAVFSALLATLSAAVTWPIRLAWRTVRGRRALRRAHVRRVVILGLDGLEPTLVERLMDEGRLPNLERLRREGSYGRLGTTWPPLSPVAWSSFSTGTGPGKHDIFDFITRRTADYRPAISSVALDPPRRVLRLGRLRIPLGRGGARLLRRSKPFWTVLGESGIFSAILRVPISFPPERFNGVQLSAMCVPDLRGSNGISQTFLDDADDKAHEPALEQGSGLRVRVERDGDVVRGELRGPRNTLRVDQPDVHVPFTVTRRSGAAAMLRIDGQRVALEPGRASRWVRVRFPVLPGLPRAHGICRFLLRRFDDAFELYCTPVQIDPRRPVMAISHPASFARYLGLQQGPFSTLGLAEDTDALTRGDLDEREFLEQAMSIHDERCAMFFDALDRVPRGLVTCVFDAPDRVQHMYWRYLEDDHPAECPDRDEHRSVIPDLYERMDELVGRTADRLDGDTAFFVMSDHGFASFRRGVDLNAWLRERGDLTLRGEATTSDSPYLADVDWSRTRAYALGLAGLYLNVRGREARGIVEPGEAAGLAEELAAELTGLRDPDGDRLAVREALRRERVYRGPYTDEAPDVVVGYEPPYRVAWEAAVGRCGAAVFADNRRAWSGDHCMHPDRVPGVLFSNRPMDLDGARIVDLAPTTLELFGVPRPAYLDGRSLLANGARGPA